MKTDTETFSSLVSSTRLRLKILESGDRDFDETFVLAFRDRDLTFHIFETETWMSLKIETFRDRDQDFSIMTFYMVPREKFNLTAAS